MALPPTAAPMPADAPPLEAEMDTGPEVVATILKKADGTYMLVAGDEPEPGMEGEGVAAEPQGQSYDTPQALMRGIMELLNPTAGAEESFAKGFRGEPDDAAMAPPPPSPMA